ncbi:MAG: SUMF1/EgtB/PvdO family nonheme iron enzyme [Gammaproteobacteria bacterium]
MTIESEQLARFVRRFDESYRLLAYYAALPLILTPELLNYLRNHFLRGQVPWVAEADLLLSDLCEPVGYEQYAMEQSVRACLLADMREQLGEAQLQHVARLLIAHVEQLLRHPTALSEQALRAERWSAMAYLSEQRGTVAHEIAVSFRNLLVPATTNPPDTSNLLSAAELAHLTRMTEMLAPELRDYPELLNYAQAVSHLLRDDPERLAAVVAELTTTTPKVSVGIVDVELPPLDVTSGTEDEQTFQYSSCVISYSSNDIDFVKLLSKNLKTHGIKTWLDAEQIASGEEIFSKIQEAVETFNCVLVCCSEAAFHSDLARIEIEATYEAVQQSHNSPYVIPLDLDGYIFSSNNDVLALSLRNQQVLDFTGWEDDPGKFAEQFKKLLEALKIDPSERDNSKEQPALTEAEQLIQQLDDPSTDHKTRAKIGDRLAEIGDPRPGVGLNEQGLPDIVWLPVQGLLTLKEKHFDIDPFYIAKYPVTWAQYRAFIQAKDGYRDKRWWEGIEREPKPGRQRWKVDNRPAENVSWYDTMAYCRWLSDKLGYEVRLPAELEWQHAATGGDEREYPWGSEWHSELANTAESGLSQTTAVGMYPGGASPAGALDMAGNVWEWCLNQYREPSITTIDDSDAARVLRGGSWDFNQDFARAECRSLIHPDLRDSSAGFRLCCSSPI